LFRKEKEEKKGSSSSSNWEHTSKGRSEQLLVVLFSSTSDPAPPPSICFEIGVYRSNIGRRVTAALCSIEGEKKSRAEVVS
jgi:hypothetical protein